MNDPYRGRPALPGFAAVQGVGVDGSILVVRIDGRFPNSDAFFTFSAIGVHFSQVDGCGRENRDVSQSE
jgi:hypothetical protein